MSRTKLVSRPLGKLNQRILGMQSIDSKLALKNGLSVENCTTVHDRLKAAIDDHYLTGVLLDEKREIITGLEKEADALSKKVLHGVVNDYGEDSINVNKVGGTRLSERAKPMTKEKKAMIAEKKALKTT